jgi:hypothetical protein
VEVIMVKKLTEFVTEENSQKLNVVLLLTFVHAADHATRFHRQPVAEVKITALFVPSIENDFLRGSNFVKSMVPP